jgi:hypothetical protein
MMGIKKCKLKLVAATIVLSAISAISFAKDYTTTVSYDSFHCKPVMTILDKLTAFVKVATVNFDTHNILLRGAAEGQPGVTRAGHIENRPLSIFNEYYFETETDGVNKGEVTITVPNVSDDFRLDCVSGHGDGLKLYGEGSPPALK